MLTSNRPVEDWGKLLGDAAAVSAMRDPPAASRPRAQVRSAELENQNGRAGTISAFSCLVQQSARRRPLFSGTRAI